MIIESGVLHVTPGDEGRFEAGVAESRHVFEKAKGFHKVEFRRGIENPSTYLLLVWWDSVEDHIAFTQSDIYGTLIGATGAFMAGPPSIFHYQEAL